MAFRVIQPRRLYQEIALQVRANIQKGELPVGARLPSERELAEQLKVSRPSVREALIALEVEGVMECVPERAFLFVHRSGLFPPTLPARVPLEIMRARIAIEGETAAMAAKQIRDADIRELGRILETMDPHLHFQDSYLPADRAFHLYIAEKAGNSVLVRIVAELFDARHSPLSLQFGKHFENAITWGQAVTEHKAVIEALSFRNPGSAKKAMQRHLRSVHNRLTKQIEDDLQKTSKTRGKSDQAPNTSDTYIKMLSSV
jgi:GntR family transcriptional regulator, transcriptional repressor for pyruvate dehydrogenase complex